MYNKTDKDEQSNAGVVQDDMERNCCVNIIFTPSIIKIQHLPHHVLQGQPHMRMFYICVNIIIFVLISCLILSWMSDSRPDCPCPRWAIAYQWLCSRRSCLHCQHTVIAQISYKAISMNTYLMNVIKGITHIRWILAQGCGKFMVSWHLP